jgi:hypothetical protein
MHDLTMSGQVERQLADEAIRVYVDWREECAAVWDGIPLTGGRAPAALMLSPRSQPTALRSTERSARPMRTPTCSSASPPATVPTGSTRARADPPDERDQRPSYEMP